MDVKTKHIDIKVHENRFNMKKLDSLCAYFYTTNRYLTKPIVHLHYATNKEELGVKPWPFSLVKISNDYSVLIYF